jgi:putative pyrimidine permease RutG
MKKSNFLIWQVREEGMILPEEMLPLRDSILMGFQHVLAMFGATVLAPILMGFDPNLTLFFSGIGTLIFFFCLGGKVPSYLGASFAFIGPVVAVMKFSSHGAALGGIIAAGLVYALIAVVVIKGGYRWIDEMMPPVVTGSVVMIIGLNLAVAAKDLLMKDPLLGTITLIAALLIAVYGRGLLARLPILLGCLLGYFIAMSIGKVDLSEFQRAAWIGIPHFTPPCLNWQAVTFIAPVAFVLVVENTGHFKAISALTSRNMMPYLGRGFLGDAIATIVAGFGGGNGVTTYAENIGVMAVTRVFSTLVYVIAACTAIILSMCPKFGALVRSIPLGVIGGIATVLFGIIAATGARIWVDGRVNFSSPVNLLVVAVTLIIGAGDFTFHCGNFTLGGIGLGTLAAIGLYQLLRHKKREVCSAEPEAEEAQ